jgi:hypothetical protein
MDTNFIRAVPKIERSVNGAYMGRPRQSFIEQDALRATIPVILKLSICKVMWTKIQSNAYFVVLLKQQHAEEREMTF